MAVAVLSKKLFSSKILFCFYYIFQADQKSYFFHFSLFDRSIDLVLPIPTCTKKLNTHRVNPAIFYCEIDNDRGAYLKLDLKPLKRFYA